MVNYSDMVDRSLLLGRSYQFETGHALRGSRLALQLFDRLQPLHDTGNTERIWLRTAALLHDVGKRISPRNHHKVARDHRGPLPRKRHAYFRDLEPEARRYVARLAALLRLDDGLDKGRTGLVQDIRCTVERTAVGLTLFGRAPATARKIHRKADLFERVFARSVVIDSESTPERRGFSLASRGETAYSRIV